MNLASKWSVGSRFLQAFFCYTFLIFMGHISFARLEAEVGAEKQTSVEEFKSAIPGALSRVEEFEFIREQAEKLGVRVWLFGGSAASFGNYLRWYLQHKNGDASYQPERFDFDFLSIFRGNQDLDLVTDATLEQAIQLEQAIKEKYPYFKGGRSTWEVRLLRENRGSKERLMNNPDFVKQNSDSASTALCEMTKPPAGEERIVDLRDLKNKENPIFLQDLLNGEIRFYDSDEHFETQRYRDEKNPKIIAAIRYLTKVFQFEYKMRSEDLALVKKIIGEFQPQDLKEGDYVFDWIQKNGIKLYENSVDVEFATKVMDQVGLREKLRAVQGNQDVVGSLAWWMSKEPLRSFEVGGGDPKARTAEDLKLSLIAHSTGSFTAWDCITRSPLGRLNVFESRQKQSGESAVYGAGLYALPGKVGAYGADLSVRMQLKPHARLGWDFEMLDPEDPEHSVIIVKNRAAIELVPKKYMEPIEYFRLLGSGILQGDDISKPLQMRVHRKYQNLPKVQREEIDQLVRAQLASNRAPAQLVKEWLSLPRLTPETTIREKFQILGAFGNDRHLFISDGQVENFVETLRAHPKSWKEVAEDLVSYYEQGGLRYAPFFYWLRATRPKRNFDSSITGKVRDWFASIAFSVKRYRSSSQLSQIVMAIIRSHFPGATSAEARAIKRKLVRSFRADSNLYVRERGNSILRFLAENILSEERWMKRQWVDLFRKKDEWMFLVSILSQAKSLGKPDAERLMDEAVHTGSFPGALVRILLLSDWKKHPKIKDWLRATLQRMPVWDIEVLIATLGRRRDELAKSEIGPVVLDILSEIFPKFWIGFLESIATETYWVSQAHFDLWMRRAQENMKVVLLGVQSNEAEFVRIVRYWRLNKQIENSLLKKWKPLFQKRAAELGWSCGELLEKLGDEP